MFNPIRYVDNNFEDPHFSDADLRSFCEDHLVRLANPDNNPGSIYSGLITDTTAKYNAYYGKITNKAVKKAIAEGTTITRNDARDAAELKIKNLQNLVKFKFGEGSAIYQEFYPLTLDEYYKAKEGDIGTLFDRFVVAATTHLTADHPLEVTAIDNLVDAFHDAYAAREAVVSEVDNLITGKNADRLALTVQLTKNFLIIASNNIGNPDKFDDYYDARFLPLDRGGDELIKSFTLPGSQTVYNVELPEGLPITAETKFRVKNKATGTAGHLAVGYFAFTSTDGPGEPPMGYVFNPGDNKVVTATQLSWIDGKAFLNFMAPGPETVEVEVYLVG